MLPISRCRKLSQSPSTSPAVHTVRARTEPKRPAPFTYFQIHAQVVHFVPFQSVLLPRRASIFSMAEWARLSCYGTPFACRFALLVQSVKATAFICRCFSAVSYLGKNRSPCLLAHTSPNTVQLSRPLLRGLRSLYRFDSVLGKSQGYSF